MLQCIKCFFRRVFCVKHALYQVYTPILHPLHTHMTHPHSGMFVVLLDEMDHLLQHNNAALIQQLLSLANTPGSRLVLLGVANSIDLVERILGLTSNGGGGEGHGDGSGGDKSGRDGGVSGGLRHMSFKAYTPVCFSVLQQF